MAGDGISFARPGGGPGENSSFVFAGVPFAAGLSPLSTSLGSTSQPMQTVSPDQRNVVSFWTVLIEKAPALEQVLCDLGRMLNDACHAFPNHITNTSGGLGRCSLKELQLEAGWAVA